MKLVEGAKERCAEGAQGRLAHVLLCAGKIRIGALADFVRLRRLPARLLGVDQCLQVAVVGVDAANALQKLVQTGFGHRLLALPG